MIRHFSVFLKRYRMEMVEQLLYGTTNDRTSTLLWRIIQRSLPKEFMETARSHPFHLIRERLCFVSFLSYIRIIPTLSTQKRPLDIICRAPGRLHLSFTTFLVVGFEYWLINFNTLESTK